MFEEVVALPDHYPWVYVNALFAANLAFEKRRADCARVRRMLDACLAHRGCTPTPS